MLSTRYLVQHFRRLVGRTERIYIGGVSMGGHVTARSIEQYPSLYDGAMPLCGVVGDVELFDFFLDFHAVAQALAGIDALPIPADYQSRVVPQMKTTLGIAAGPPTNALGAQFRDVVIEQSGGRRPGAERRSTSGRTSCSGSPRRTTVCRLRSTPVASGRTSTPTTHRTCR